MLMESTLVLASASPRRRQLLSLAGVSFHVVPSDVDEIPAAGETPEQFTERAAHIKAQAVADCLEDGIWILGADTTVAVDEHILGKPKDHQDAARMLNLLSGRDHRVLTAVELRQAGTERVFNLLARTKVSFRQLDAKIIAAYLDTGEADDKAGAYGIQGRGAMLVRSIAGSYTNVVGLPLVECTEMLQKVGLWSPNAGEKQAPAYQEVLL